MTATMDDATREMVRAHIAREGLLEPGEAVLAAVSGGADSVALLLLLVELGYAVGVCHFDHQTREGESAADLKFVRALAARLAIPFHSTSAPVAAIAVAAGESFETCARRLRYGWLADIARETGIQTVATGHHLDDQAETALMRIVRGTGVAGLGGIQPLREEGRMRIVRPLLCCRRGEMAAWLEARGQAWRTDASNSDTHYLRNRIRHGLMPLLRTEFNHRIEAALARLTDNARVDNALLDQLAAEGWRRCVSEDGGLDREAFRREPEAIQRRIAAAYIAGAGGEAAQDHVLAAVRLAGEGATGALVDIGGGRQLHAGRHTLRVMPAPGAAAAVVMLETPGTCTYLGRRFSAVLLEERPAEDLRQYCRPWRQVLDADRVAFPLLLRTWEPGDRFRPLGMSGTRKLQDYFVDRGIDGPDRGMTPLLCDEMGILWIAGHAMSAEAAVTEATQHFLEITITPCD